MSASATARPGQRVLLKDGRWVSYLGQDIEQPEMALVRTLRRPGDVRSWSKPWLVATKQIVRPG